ncbi:hypothetical protein GWK90_07170 [Candidatus Hamiltonella defensa]|uniref:Uncharacterized protein n=1 Tax=Candidatus Williamhamiltonella defendens TaxID=138072 RepID=A0AAC9VLI3_9ENTR|nr:hypothetical protein CJJ18_08400 [Candidatus Hamiltonella defensa]AWK16949.1 hypothetical protein CCS40_08215 [Candidatus Hamiltonella defensa]MBK4362002.1 hypothetical protein [Candidatus Hamiltonella defensa]
MSKPSTLCHIEKEKRPIHAHRHKSHRAPVQDALDLGVSTEQEIDTLHAWKTYRVALHRLDPKAREMACLKCRGGRRTVPRLVSRSVLLSWPLKNHPALSLHLYSLLRMLLISSMRVTIIKSMSSCDLVLKSCVNIN